jgi:hypothetical protein
MFYKATQMTQMLQCLQMFQNVSKGQGLTTSVTLCSSRLNSRRQRHNRWKPWIALPALCQQCDEISENMNISNHSHNNLDFLFNYFIVHILLNFPIIPLCFIFNHHQTLKAYFGSNEKLTI